MIFRKIKELLENKQWILAGLLSGLFLFFVAAILVALLNGLLIGMDYSISGQPGGGATVSAIASGILLSLAGMPWFLMLKGHVDSLAILLLVPVFINCTLVSILACFIKCKINK